MSPLYAFDWLHEKAARLRYGSFDVQIKVSGGKIVTVSTIPGTERESRSLEDVRREGTGILE